MASKKETPSEWDGPEDARKKGGKYPNYDWHSTQSGHSLMFDDTEGHESVTIQHRSGSMVQFLPDGGVCITAHNGQFNIVFGENRMKVTGAYDVLVEGSASLKVKGDYNVTCEGNMNIACAKDFNITAKNLNENVRGNRDTVAKNVTLKAEGSISQRASQAGTYTAGKGLTLASKGSGVAIGAADQIGIHAHGGELLMKSGGKASLKASAVAIEGGTINLNTSGAADDVEEKFQVESAEEPQEETPDPNLFSALGAAGVKGFAGTPSGGTL